MRLWLLRHGEAEVQARSDAERALTAHGCQEVRQATVQLEGRALGAILASPYVRAQQTAALVRDALGYTGAIHTVPWLTPDSDPREVLRQLDRYDDGELLLVSHQPLVGTLAGLLIHGHRQQPLPMHTASLAELEGDVLAAGLMDLLALVHPQHG
ncbi:phosphohistidine phosphatase SixA [Pseudomonas sp. MMS21-TM103]|uniref:phosphohistidine phosphatase SixA n=1 Tax=unclassified Pseudomonas TaxID=196821 RepID=UPI001EDD53AC|nr:MULTISPECIES: phosphohistidine phosphatase SixA [unclassified Pseudomonas]MCG4453423.1 phosphohistidine phosphatase SixA [Pseudomonas sp. MMS21 TM103]